MKNYTRKARRNSPEPLTIEQKERLWEMYCAEGQGPQTQVKSLFASLGYPRPKFSGIRISQHDLYDFMGQGLDGIYLRDVDFSGCHIVPRDLRLSARRLVNVSFSHIEISDLELSRAEMADVDFSQCIISHIMSMHNCFFLRCNFRGTVAGYSGVNEATFYSSDLSKVRFNTTSWDSHQMVGGSLMGADLGRAMITGCTLDNVDIRGLKVARSQLGDYPTRPLKIKAKGNDFTGLDVRGSDLSGIVLRPHGWLPLEKAIKAGVVRYNSDTRWPRGLHAPKISP